MKVRETVFVSMRDLPRNRTFLLFPELSSLFTFLEVMIRIIVAVVIEKIKNILVILNG